MENFNGTSRQQKVGRKKQQKDSQKSVRINNSSFYSLSESTPRSSSGWSQQLRFQRMRKVGEKENEVKWEARTHQKIDGSDVDDLISNFLVFVPFPFFFDKIIICFRITIFKHIWIIEAMKNECLMLDRSFRWEIVQTTFLSLEFIFWTWIVNAVNISIPNTQHWDIKKSKSVNLSFASEEFLPILLFLWMKTNFSYFHRHTA